MMLAVALAHHEDALRASMYMHLHGLRLEDARLMPAREVAALVAWLPPGCPLWKSIGGPAALSDEARELRTVEFRIRQMTFLVANHGKGTRPKPAPWPEYAHEKRAAEARMQKKAARFLARQQKS